MLILSETHLNDSKLRHLNIPNYNILCRSRVNKQGGEVALLVHETLSYIDHSDLDSLYNENFECKFIELKSNQHKTIIVGSIY